MNESNEYAWNVDEEKDITVELDEPEVCTYCSTKGVIHLGLCFDCFNWISIDEMKMWYTVYRGKEDTDNVMTDY
jgi:hypothetical protein